MNSLKKFYNKIFSSKNVEGSKIITCFGIRIRLKSKSYKDTQKSIKVQDSYNLAKLTTSEKVIVFLIPNIECINGGVMSIFSLCKYSRYTNKAAACLIATCPGKLTYDTNKQFDNNEQIYRWQQVVDNVKNAKELIIHIPEYYAGSFYKALKDREISFLKSINVLQINIMNQNIELMPSPEALTGLMELTKNITQTTAHHRYATQEKCNKWQIPTHLFSPYIDVSKYKIYPFEQKEKIIVISPDNNEQKEKIIQKIKTELSEFKVITVNNMTFDEYMDLISRAFCTITFGEGYDAYFTQPCVQSSVGFAVYNSEFFPSIKWLELDNVFASYDDMYENIIKTIKRMVNSEEYYSNLYISFGDEYHKLHSFDSFESNLRRFYNREYDFLPESIDGEKEKTIV